jgi:hypothetical protein
LLPGERLIGIGVHDPPTGLPLIGESDRPGLPLAADPPPAMLAFGPGGKAAPRISLYHPVISLLFMT